MTCLYLTEAEGTQYSLMQCATELWLGDSWYFAIRYAEALTSFRLPEPWDGPLTNWEGGLAMLVWVVLYALACMLLILSDPDLETKVARCLIPSMWNHILDS